MPVVRLYASTFISGTWTNSANMLGASDDVLATRNPTRRSQETSYVGGFDASVIPTGSTINSIKAAMRTSSQTTDSTNYMRFRPAITTTLIATETTATNTTALTDKVSGSQPMTETQLRDANLRMRILVYRDSSSNNTFSVDSVWFEVDYTETATGEEHTGSAALSASGTLTVLGTPNFSAPVSLSASGNAGTAQTPATGSSTNLSGAGIMVPAASPAVSRSTTFSGSGTLAPAASAGFSSGLSMSGMGALTTPGSPSPVSSSATSGSGTLSTAVSTALAGGVALSGSATLSTVAVAALTAPLELSAGGQLATSGTPELAAPVAFSGTGQLTAAGTVDTGPTFTGAAGLSGGGSLAVSGTAAVRVNVGFTGSGNAETGGRPAISSPALLSGMGLLSVSTPLEEYPVYFSAEGSLVIVGSRVIPEVVISPVGDRVSGRIAGQDTSFSMQGERASGGLVAHGVGGGTTERPAALSLQGEHASGTLPVRNAGLRMQNDRFEGSVTSNGS